MVYHNPNPTSGAMKRSASALDGPPGWDVPPPMMSSQSPCHIPFAHYALIYVDSSGKLGCEESASIMEQNTTLFTPDVRQAFLETLGEKIGFPQPIAGSSPRRVRRRRGNAPASMTNSRLADDSDSEDYSPAGNETTSIRVGDSAKIFNYYESALKHFQQLNCRMVAKAFIKFIEPRKQVRHPYNGGKPPAGSAPGATGDPEKTKPEWWPPGVMHKEPDHLRKEYRIELLIHIIRKLGGYGITADKLKEVASDTKRSLKHPSHVDIILEILRVRKMEEKWERGEIDGSTLVYVMNRGPSPKGDEEEESGDGPIATLDAEHIEDGLLTPSSSVEHAAPLATPIDTMSVPRSLPGSFSLAEPLPFEARDRPFYATPPQYQDTFSQSMLSTPVTAEMISPHDVSVFAYPSQPSYPSSTPDQHWSTPSFRQDIFSPVGYNAPATTQPMAHTSMAYSMPMAPPTHLHGLPSEQSTMDAANRSLPFRTGSLGHPHPHGSPLAHLS
ncbi:hypothetical protein PENSTE_c015G01815 [Penicillium steckii]|uniref:Subtelomeric hrmA-associated cluster protein AFUB-079030/YDR124W-like helical bundle domain-containing protein n=1 Tax=Penicillium steckii TaxID=303698 RepID=A0A1V6SZM5_9EURO|nr:hypothetical protein PENSTE_c015G01815 [Penicillium steckii]